MRKEIFTRAEVLRLLTETARQTRKRLQTSKQPEHGNGAVETEQSDSTGNTSNSEGLSSSPTS